MRQERTMRLFDPTCSILEEDPMQKPLELNYHDLPRS